MKPREEAYERVEGDMVIEDGSPLELLRAGRAALRRWRA